jgi:hypothetical protein
MQCNGQWDFFIIFMVDESEVWPLSVSSVMSMGDFVISTFCEGVKKQLCLLSKFNHL